MAWIEKGLFQNSFHSISQRKQGKNWRQQPEDKNLEAGTEAETLDEHCLLQLPPCVLLSLPFYDLESYLLKRGVIHSGLGPPISIIH